jgi:Winged helix-turn-helix domain (DUF2582)
VEQEIGNAINAVWRYLNERRPTPLETLRRNTKLPDSLLFMALGWLAREGNVEFIQDKRVVRIALKTQ